MAKRRENLRSKANSFPSLFGVTKSTYHVSQQAIARIGCTGAGRKAVALGQPITSKRVPGMAHDMCARLKCEVWRNVTLHYFWATFWECLVEWRLCVCVCLVRMCWVVRGTRLKHLLRAFCHDPSRFFSAGRRKDTAALYGRS